MDATVTSSRPNQAVLRRVDALLGPASAVLLGLATGFFFLAMPARVLGAFVSTLGLPPAVAESPVLMAAAVALMAAAATWWAFRIFDRKGRGRPKQVAMPPVAATPVLRRNDAHPDAPARRPIFAASDLGPPLDLIDPLPADDGPASPVAAASPVLPATSDPPPPGPELPEAVSATDPPPPFAYPTMSAAPAPAVAMIDSPPSLAGVMGRLEAGLARKALALGEGDGNVTPFKRDIAPFRGDIRAALDKMRGQTAGGP